MTKPTSVLTMLAITAALTGSAAVTAPGAGAMPDLTSVTSVAAGTRVTTTPDVGPPGEDQGHENIPAVGPDGRLYPRTTGTGPTRSGGVQASGEKWRLSYATANGARIRSRPVNGAVLGTLRLNEPVWVDCWRFGSDNNLWDWVSRNGTYGWVRSDLIRNAASRVC